MKFVTGWEQTKEEIVKSLNNDMSSAKAYAKKTALGDLIDIQLIGWRITLMNDGTYFLDDTTGG